MITVVDDYFAKGCGRCDRFGTPECSTQSWKRGLLELRRICLDEGLEETVKWGHPCFVRNGRNIAIIGAFRADFRLSFFNASLMRDPEGILEKQGPNARHPDMIRFEDEDRVHDIEGVIRAYLRKAMGYADAGLRPVKEPDEVELPVELSEALAADPELSEAFVRLTPGRKKSYVIHLTTAKKSDTRIARIAKLRDKIIAGKGAMER
ncbi:MAG: hypothetical protein HC923_00905 [Myxococcales bacterium]|nr:hypothetical protein [Myxococcales bacterium]